MQVTMILGALRDLVTTGKGLDETSGPVGIVSLVSTEVREGGFSAFVQLLTLISINLGLMNLLPIPGLDGSRLLFGLIEVVRGKPIPPQKEAVVHLVGMVFLFGVMIFFTFRDVMRLFQ
jgi:regulator of sigma E protease